MTDSGSPLLFTALSTQQKVIHFTTLRTKRYKSHSFTNRAFSTNRSNRIRMHNL